MKIVLHIGAHKTATTTIQKVLANNRTSLARAGVWYPAYSEIFPSMSDHYAHLDIAKGLMSDSKRFTPEKVEQFFGKLDESAARKGVDTVLISAEPFYRGQFHGDEPFWRRREQYIEKLRSIIPFSDVRVVLVLRRQDDYLESLYNEHVKATRYSKDVWSFLDEYGSRFDYKRQIELWSKYFPALKVATFEEIVKGGNVTEEFLKLAVGRRDFSLESTIGVTNASLPIDLVDFKRLLNGTSMSRPELDAVVPVLIAVAQARTGEDTERASRLSEADCREVLARFDEDNAWINDRFFSSRPEGLFPAGIGARRTVTQLDVRACANIASEVIRTHILPSRE